VTFNSNPTGAEVTITDNTGFQIQKGTAPLTLKLKSGSGFFQAAYYTIEAKMDGYSTIKARLYANMNGWYFGNIFIGGIVGLLCVDPATGAMWKLPKKYCINLSKATADNSERTLHIVSIDSIPKELRSQLTQIK
jgi:hypothetical protein